MEFLTNDKLVIVGAGGMIGSNMVQSALMLGLTPNICLYDIFEPGVHFTEPTGTEEELASLQKSYEHLCKMRDEIVELGIVPPVAEWKEMNPNL